MQCFSCLGYLFFKPLPDETFACCVLHEETVEDINIRTGVSLAIECYGLKKNICVKHNPGESICFSLDGEPFKIHPKRLIGEKFLKQVLTA